MTCIQSELADAMADAIAEEIDWEVMCILMKSTGWTLVEIDQPATADINRWCTDNLKGKFKNRNHSWMFERIEDANWFILRWSA